MTNILFVVNTPIEINTSASIRNRAYIKGLLELGHSVDVLTTGLNENHPNFDKRIKMDNLKIKYLEVGNSEKLIQYSNKFQVFKPIKNKIYKYMNEKNIYDRHSKICTRRVASQISLEKYDILITSSDPKSSHLLGEMILKENKECNIPWIQVWGDPFYIDITRKTKKNNKAIKNEEARLLSLASKIVYVSPITLDKQIELYPLEKDKMFSYPIPYLETRFYDSAITSNSLNILYTGDYNTEIRNILPLYKAVKDSEHKLTICGGSDMKLPGQKNIKVYPRQNSEIIKNLEKNADILVHLSNLKGTQVPGKIYQYSGTNKPILFILDGNAKDIHEMFKGYERYIFCENNEQSIKYILKNEKLTTNWSPVYDFSPNNIAGKLLEKINFF